ncbi:imelysin family protein [Pseudoalteromonas sp. MMG012]|uniref:imelysin family protein n=1 Tax=Pseudoalteromonas sp. MMG012 TaxID=2822686 RepID=UPI001B3A5482|nr:imelysin family protein [Pseudoalteromonas sp. MMG012]MBQ4850919.1 metalloproteinase [Pseudoalteromonas sp. MMG012]
MKNIKNIALTLVCTAVLAACSGDDGKDGTVGTAGVQGEQGVAGVSNFVTAQDVVNTNAQHAYAAFADSLIAAKFLQEKVNELVQNPTEANFTAAKSAWLAAREPYGQTEVYRFREGPIDALTKNEADEWVLVDGEGPEGAINAWPLAEALIDYTIDMDGNEGRGNAAVYQNGGNIIHDATSFPVITKALLQEKFELDGEEANVTSGYHAVEFLLWGQDLNADLTYTANRDYTAGHRPVTDFYTAATIPADEANGRTCTSGEQGAQDAVCERRAQFLIAAADLLVDDLQNVVNAWKPGSGFHYSEYTKAENVDKSLASMFESMGRLSFGELAGERMSIAVRTDSQEDEHSCFSDNTHRDIWLNAKGVQNHYSGSYTKVDGEALIGASIHDLLVVKGHHELANELRAAFEATMATASVIDNTAKLGMSFDVQIQNEQNKQDVYSTIQALVKQTELIQKAVDALGLEIDNSLKGDTEEDI